jgi:hypothetical protein
MKKLRYFIFICLLVTSIGTFSQQLAKFEYFFDTDPGLGKGISITLNKQKVDTNYVLSVSALPNGLHTFFVRAIDSSGHWSLTTTSSFVKYSGVDTVLNVDRIEYFFDTDPGFGNGTPFTITPANTISNIFNFTVPDNGTNSTTFHLRVRDSYGRWSLLYDTTYNLCQLYKVTPNFGYVRYGNQFSLIDSSLNNTGHNLKWVYDDQSGADTIMNPVHSFPIGKHFVKLVAGRGCRIDSITKGLFAGIESYSPTNILGGADYNVDIYGSGFDSSVTATLNDGATIITPVSKRYLSASHVVYQFNFHNSLNTKVVKYLDLAVHFPGSHYDTVIQKAIAFSPFPDISATPDTINTLIRPVLDVTLNQPGVTGSNTWHTGSYSIQYTGWEYLAHTISNISGSTSVSSFWLRSNDQGGPVAKMIPFSFTFDGQLQSFQVLNYTIVNYDADTVKLAVSRFDSLPTFRYVDSLGGIPYKGWVYEIVIPEIAPGQTITINYRYLTPTQLTAELKTYYWVGRSMIGSPLQSNTINCFANAISIVSTLASFIPALSIVPALTGCGTTIAQQIYNSNTGSVDTYPSFASAVGNILGSCITAIPSVYEGLKVVSTISNLVMAGNAVNFGNNVLSTLQPCHDCFFPPWESSTWNFASADPNEIVGPLGYDTLKKYVDLYRALPYQISCENKASAARSAQTVFITDTLSNKFNISSLQLTNFAIGDTVFNIPPFRKEYTATVDLTKKQKVLLRFNARVDSASRVLKCTFYSLDPVSKQVLTDTTLAGFLPPDKDGIAGKASVSFIISQDTLNNKNLDTLANRASIVFDNNAQIITNTWRNILDKVRPSGKIDSVKLVSDTTFRIYFSGADNESGLRFNDLYTSTNGGAYTGATISNNNSVLIKGNKDTAYDLILVPHDNVGNFLPKINSEIHFTLFNLGPITGDSVFCTGTNKKLSDTTAGGKWSSSDSSVASVDAAGNVTPLKAGSAVISYTVTRNGITGTSIKPITVAVTPPRPTITRDSTNSLVSSATAGNQWYTDTTAAINGATSQSYHPGVPNYYSVRVTQNGCSSLFSDKYYYLVTAIVTIGGGNYINIAPNPTKDFIVIRHNLSGNNIINIELFDLNGKKILSKNNVPDGDRIAVSQLAGGMYILKIYNSSGKIIGSEKIIKL